MPAAVEPRVIRAEGFEHSEMVAAVGRTSARFVALVRSLEPGESAKPVPGLEWTVAQVAAHLIGIVMRGTGDRRRAPTIDELGALNELQIEEIAEADPSRIADLLEARLRRQLAALAKATGDEPFELHAGVYASVKTALSYELWDFLIHGVDIARATGREWTIDPADAALDVVAVLPPLEPWLRPEVRAASARRVSFTFAQFSRAIVVRTGDASYSVALEERGEAEEVDPVDVLLALSQRSESANAVVRELASWYLPT